MKKLLSIILALLMVVNLGVFATVGAEETNPALEFKGNAKALLEIAVKHAQTTGTFANSTIALTQGQSITYTINSDEATPVKFWWNNHATFNGTQTYDLTINGEKVVEENEELGFRLEIPMPKTGQNFDVRTNKNEETGLLTIGVIKK